HLRHGSNRTGLAQRSQFFATRRGRRSVEEGVGDTSARSGTGADHAAANTASFDRRRRLERRRSANGEPEEVTGFREAALI
ncbi:MAG TPA: hypothetical protein VKR27_08425, partial [Acidimicrobiales bacterium]|nr:hypothetical protein [Acidimicrobiales bacterium]